MDAIQAAIIYMEDSPLFNAGKGAVFTADEKNALDASIMDGETQNAGAVAGVERIKNPIIAARAVMEKSSHVMLAEEGAEEFALGQGIEMVDPQYFFTQRRFDALNRVKEKEKEEAPIAEEDKHGTVGAVALDKFGNLAAGTSTGGMTNKKYGRIGDAPIIGAGTYADNASCAVSSTGHGEYFIRYAVAHDIAARMEYKGISLQEAADEVVMDKLVEKGGSGGIISVDKLGNVALVFNSEGMYRGYATPNGREVAIYDD
jgi:beta-aspartyl-peptidase (threonine type)